MLIITVFQLIIYHFSFGKISAYEAVMQQKPDIVLFGSSVEKHRAPKDQDRRTLHEILADSLARPLKVQPISGGAFHLELYEGFIEHILRHYDFSGVLIIPINLRSFSPEWHQRPEYQFEQEKLILREGRYWGGFLSTLSVFKYQYTSNKITAEEFQNAPVRLGDKVQGKVKDFINEIDTPAPQFMKEGFLLNYLNGLHAEHGKVQALRRICQSLKQAQIRAFFYISPIDYEKGIMYYPHHFRKIVNENISLLQEIIEAEGYSLLNLVDLCASSDFDYSIRANEHLNERGRQLLAKHLAAYLEKEVLP